MRTMLFRLIGMLEIAGGFFGAVAMLRRLLPFHGGAASLVSLVGLLVFGFILVAGVLLVEGSERGVSLSKVAQLLQLPLLATPVLSYALHSGAFINVFATLQSTPRLGLDWQVASQGFHIALGGPHVSRIGINLLALLCWLGLRVR